MLKLLAPESYTPKYLADKILTSRSTIEGERKLVTVLFADVANFTSISEKLDPEEVHLIMDGCFKILMDEIHKYEGTIPVWHIEFLSPTATQEYGYGQRVFLVIISKEYRLYSSYLQWLRNVVFPGKKSCLRNCARDSRILAIVA